MTDIQHWPRWTKASTVDYINTQLVTTYGVDAGAIYVDGGPRTTNDKNPFFEVRVDGPWFYEVSKNYWYLDIEVNILLQTVVSKTDLYAHQVSIGYCTDLLRKAICAYKYGTGVDDDDTLWATYLLRQNVRDRQRIQVNDFGQVDIGVQVQQATIEAHFRAQVEFTS